MTGTYVCWQKAAPDGEWAIFLIGSDGGRQVVSCFSCYPQAVRHLRQLRAVSMYLA